MPATNGGDEPGDRGADERRANWPGVERRTGSRAVLEQRFVEAMLRAGEALGEISGQPLLTDVPELRRYTASQILDLAGGPGTTVIAVYVAISGPLVGHALLLLSPEDARRLAGLLLDDVGADPSVHGGLDMFREDPLVRSALGETGNIVIANFLTAFAPPDLGDRIHASVPQMVVDMAGAILDGILVVLTQTSETFLVARTAFHGGGVRIDATLLVLPRTDTLPGFAQPDATPPAQ
jgi:chemotaxis protein CheC